MTVTTIVANIRVQLMGVMSASSTDGILDRQSQTGGGAEGAVDRRIAVTVAAATLDRAVNVKFLVFEQSLYVVFVAFINLCVILFFY